MVSPPHIVVTIAPNDQQPCCVCQTSTEVSKPQQQQQQQQAHSNQSQERMEHQAAFIEAESTAFPAVFRGLNRHWPALSLWAGPSGLQHLKAAAGTANVQAMYAASSDFFGDIEHHQSVACSLGQLLEIAQQQQQTDGPADAASVGQTAAAAAAAAAKPPGSDAAAPGRAASGPPNMNLYLAQQSLQEPGLSSLLPDVPVPPLLQDKQLTSINMWFSSRQSRSSLHYDPYQNLLCVVTGCKRVRLYSPAAVLGLYPRALGGEASNHSSVNFAQPDFEQHTLYRHVLEQGMEVELHPGDALFLPEGWWHQVDSSEMTLAVNFWWSSQLTSQLRALPHQQHYYLRLLLASTSSEAVQQLLAGITHWQPQASKTAAATAAAAVAAGQQTAREDNVQAIKAAAAAAEARAAVALHPGQDTGQTETEEHSSKHRRLSVGEPAAAAAGEPAEPAPASSSGEQQQAATAAAAATDLDSFEQAALAELVQAVALTSAGVQQPGDNSDFSKGLQQEHGQQQQAAATEHYAGPRGVANAAAEPGESHPAAELLADSGWLSQQAEAQQQLLAAAMTGQQLAAAHGSVQATSSCSSRGIGSHSRDQLGLTSRISQVLAALRPQQLLKVLWVASSTHAAAVGQLLLQGLSPAAAQLLTQMLEEGDALFFDEHQQQLCQAEGQEPMHARKPVSAAGGGAGVGPNGSKLAFSRAEFYAQLYSTVPDPGAVLHALLAKSKLECAAADLIIRTHTGGALAGHDV